MTTPTYCPFCSSTNLGHRTSGGHSEHRCASCTALFRVLLHTPGAPSQSEETEPLITNTPQSLPRRIAGLFGNIVANVIIVGLAITTLIMASIYGEILGTGSMEPTLSGGDFVWENYFAENFQRGDIVTLPNPEKDPPSLIKRIVGLPGETVRVSKGTLFINDKPFPEPWIPDFANGKISSQTVILGPNEFYVLGDNRRYSHDSTEFGPVHRHLLHKVFLHIDWNPLDVNFGPQLRTMNKSAKKHDAKRRLLEVNKNIRAKN